MQDNSVDIDDMDEVSDAVPRKRETTRTERGDVDSTWQFRRQTTDRYEPSEIRGQTGGHGREKRRVNAEHGA